MNWNEIKRVKAVKEVKVASTAGTAAVTITIAKGFEALKIRNINTDDPTKVIKASFDAGTSWFEIPYDSDFEFGAGDTLQVKGVKADTKYEVFYLERQ